MGRKIEGNEKYNYIILGSLEVLTVFYMLIGPKLTSNGSTIFFAGIIIYSVTLMYLREAERGRKYDVVNSVECWVHGYFTTGEDRAEEMFIGIKKAGTLEEDLTDHDILSLDKFIQKVHKERQRADEIAAHTYIKGDNDGLIADFKKSGRENKKEAKKATNTQSDSKTD